MSWLIQKNRAGGTVVKIGPLSLENHFISSRRFQRYIESDSFIFLRKTLRTKPSGAEIIVAGHTTMPPCCCTAQRSRPGKKGRAAEDRGLGKLFPNAFYSYVCVALFHLVCFDSLLPTFFVKGRSIAHLLLHAHVLSWWRETCMEGSEEGRRLYISGDKN